MPKFGSQIDTQRIPVKGLRPESGTAFPASPVEGQLFHKSDEERIYAYLSEAWIGVDNGSMAAAVHVHAIGDVTNLQSTLDGKAAAAHMHAIADVTGLSAALAAKSDTGHAHAIADTTGLQAALDAKADDTTTISPGAGLTGGGSLAANRTLSVDFGTGANQALRGNTPLNNIALPTWHLAMDGFRIGGVAEPVNSDDAATKNYVDAAVQGLSVKDSVRVAVNTNVNLASPGASLDGVAMTAFNRVLLRGQTTASQNGIYRWDTASTAMVRTADADTAAKLLSAFVFVEEGTSADSGFVQTADSITLGTTNIVWTQFSGAGQVTSGAGLTKTGNTLDVVGTANRITVNADNVDIASNYAGQSSITTVGTITSGVWNGTAVPVANGGTGATNAAAALTNLGAAAASHTHTTAQVTGLDTALATKVDTAGAGLTKTGTSVDVVGTANRIQVNADNIDIHSGYVGQTSITTLGTVGTGTWNATAIATTKGGTGATDAFQGRINLGAAAATSRMSPALVAGVWSANITHNFASGYVDLTFIEAATGEVIVLDWKYIDNNNVQIRSDLAYAASAIRILITSL